MTNEEEQQEMFYKFSMFERQIREIQQQIEAVERGIVDLKSLNYGLDELVGSKDKEIFAALGKGIFVKAKIISEELNVDIGSGNFIKKDIPQTKSLIEEQTLKLSQVKAELEDNLREIEKEITSMMNMDSHDCHCEEGKECECGDDCNCKKEKRDESK